MTTAPQEPHVRLMGLVRRVDAFTDAQAVVEDAIARREFTPERGERCLNAIQEAQKEAVARLEEYKAELGIH